MRAVKSVRSTHRSLRAVQTLSPASLPPAPLLSIYDPTPFSSVEGGDDYASLATKGQLYEYLMAATGLSRKAVKKGLLRDVFGKRRHYASPLEQAFRECFPAVWSFVRWFNRDSHAALLRQLQRVESELVIHRVGHLLQELDCTGCVSLYDAVYCAREDIGMVEQAFREVVGTVGVHLRQCGSGFHSCRTDVGRLSGRVGLSLRSARLADRSAATRRLDRTGLLTGWTDLRPRGSPGTRRY